MEEERFILAHSFRSFSPWSLDHIVLGLWHILAGTHERANYSSHGRMSGGCGEGGGKWREREKDGEGERGGREIPQFPLRARLQ
jgi:hypothetical protein